MDRPDFILKPPPSLGNANPGSPRRVNAMTVDVEDYFQVQALEAQFPRDTWEGLPLRVGDSTRRLLDLFAAHSVKATFFSLAWVAQKDKPLMRTIVDQGHELASHGMTHIRADSQSRAAFRDDVKRSKDILQDTSGQEVTGYRAATFSIGANNLWALEVLAEEGYRYSSSINPVAHDNYASIDAPRFAFSLSRAKDFDEIPISTYPLFGRNMPCGGGGYFRLLPYPFFKTAIRHINEKDGWPAVFYFHPWEIDVDQPRPQGVRLKSRLRHYTNLEKMEKKLTRLMKDFSWDRMDRVFIGDAAQTSGLAS